MYALRPFFAGTGWVDSAGMLVSNISPGSEARVTMRYFLFEQLSLMAEPGYGADIGRALFRQLDPLKQGRPG